MSYPGSKYLDPEILAQLPNLELKARRLVESLFVGFHKSPQFGYSVEFADHREYVQGDDLRNVDWKVWARKNRYYVKRFEMEAQLKCNILLDVSGSMGFGSGALSKLEYSSYLAAALAHILGKQNDLAGLITFDSQVRNYLRPGGSRAHLRALLHLLGTVETGPQTGVAKVCHELAESIKSRGIIVLISDLLDDEEKVVSALQHLQHRKHDVIVFHVLDDKELDLSYNDVANFVDMESGETLAVDPLGFQATYKERINRFCDAVEQGCRKGNVDYHRTTTSTPIETLLGQFLAFRLRRSH